MINLSNIPIYWINLDRCVNRKEYLEEQIKKNKIKKTIRVSGIDGKNINLDDYKNRMKNINIYELGCTLSHIKAIKLAKENKEDYALILEDDCSFEYLKYQRYSILELIKKMDQKDKDWGILQLCCTNKRNNELVKLKQLTLKGYRNCTTGYLINKKGMESIEKIQIYEAADTTIYKVCNTHYLIKPYFIYNYSNIFKSTICNQGGDSNKTQYVREDNNKKFWDCYYFNDKK